MEEAIAAEAVEALALLLVLPQALVVVFGGQSKCLKLVLGGC